MKKLVNACKLCGGNCWNCLLSDECDEWLSNGGNHIPQVEVEVHHASMALCEGRHSIPQAVDGSIFGNEVDPLDVEGMEFVAKNKLRGLKSLDLYVTGLTVALVATLNVCRQYGVKITLHHFDRNSGSYYTQEVK